MRFAHTFSERCIWHQVLKDILAVNPIPRVQQLHLSMSTDEIIRVCVVAYRFNQYMSKDSGRVPVLVNMDFQPVPTSAGGCGFLPGGDYFVVQEDRGDTLTIRSVEHPQSGTELFTTSGLDASPHLLAARCRAWWMLAII